MKEKTESQQMLHDLFNAAKAQGLAHTQKEFAALIGLNVSVLSTLMQGAAPLTEQMEKRILDACATAGITSNGNAVNVNSPQSTANASDPRWFDLVAEKDKQIDRLLGIIEKMQK